MQITHKLSRRVMALLTLFVIGLVIMQWPGIRSATFAYSHAAADVARLVTGQAMAKDKAMHSKNTDANQAISTKYKVVGAPSLPSTFTSPFAIGITVGTNVNVSQRTGNESEAMISINPYNPNQLVALSNISSGSGLFKAFSTDGGATWTTDIIADGDALGTACCDAQAAGVFDEFGNFFMVYLQVQPNTFVRTGISTDGGATINPLATLTAVNADQPSLAIGAGTVWVTYESGNQIRARGAAVTSLGVVGAFNAEQTAPSSTGGNFGDIAIGPSGQVMVVYQNPTGGQGPATIFANVDADGLGGGGFGAQITVTTTNVGGFDFIPAQSGRSIDAEAGLAWDRSGGPHHGRVYMVYTDENIDESNDTDIFVRFSDNNGATWSPRIRVNDDATTRSQFLPRIAVDQTSGNLAVSWHDCRNDTGVVGPDSTNGTANDDAQFFATFSTTFGASFLPNVKVSAGTSNAAAAANGIDYGDYTGLAFHAGRAFPIWADNSNSTNNNPNGALSRFDIYTAQLLLVGQDADLAVSKLAFVAPPVGSNPINAVIAGGTSNTLANLTDANNSATNGTGNITYVLNFSNAGPAHAVNVRLEDFIPGIPSDIRNTGNVPIIGNATIGGVAVNVVLGATGTNTTFAINCSVPGSQFAPGAKLICSPGNNTAMNPSFQTGVLPAGFQGQLAYRLQARPGAQAGSILVNSALINSNAGNGAPSTSDPNAGNNASLQTNNIVITQTDLGITKVTSNPTPTAGGAAFSYTLTVTNNGPSDARNILVNDPLPPGVIFQNVAVVNNPSIAGFGLACSGPPVGTNGTVTCTGNLPGPNPAVSTSTITIVAQIVPNVASGVRTNTATVSSDTQEVTPNVAPNTASVQQNIQVDAPLSITKAGPATLCPGQIYTYHITVNNGGSSTALNATISDPLPANTTFLNQTGTGAFTHGCSHNGGTPGTVTCSAVDIPQGLSTLDITVQLSPNAPSGPLANTATITTAGTGTIAIGTSTTTAVVAPCATLNVTKIVQSAVTQASNPNQTGPIGPASPNGGVGVTGTAVLPGTRMTYRLNVSNSGPNPVSNIRVLDTLPSNLKFVSATQASGFSTIFSCQQVGSVDPNGFGGQVQCTAPVLSAQVPDNAATIDVVVDIDAATKVQIVNNVVVNATISNTTQQATTNTTLNTPVQPLSDLTLTKTADPTSVFPGTFVMYTLTVKNNGPSVAAMTNVVDTLPPGQTLSSADVSGAPGFTCTGTTVVTCSAASLGVNVTAVIKLTAFVAENVTAGVYTNSATASSMSLDPTPATATATVTVVVKPAPGPGNPYPVLSEASDQKAGSVLIYPIYTSDATSPSLQNTRISITNISPQEKICVHLYAVDGASCSVADAFICLTANQTTSFLASDLDPGSTGYIVAMAVDCNNGLPKAFNCLIGDEFVKFSSGHQANLGAESISAGLVFPVGTNPNVTSATLKFDGIAYNRLPRVLASSSVPSQPDTNSTMLILDRIGGNLSGAGATIGSITGLLFDDSEASFSFTANIGSCQYRKILDNSFPRTLPPFNRAIAAGHTGWLKVWRLDDGALIGSQINFNPNTNASSNAFNQGHNLHALTLTDKAELTVPVFIPSC